MKQILFVTDYVCPYCIVAKEALKAAMKQTGIQAKIIVQPFELTREPSERIDTCHDEERKSRYKKLLEPCETLGLDAKFPPNVCPRPYTRLAFEGLHYAVEKGFEEVYSDAMYHAYFVDEKDIGDIEVLVSIAEKLGMDKEEYRHVLLHGTYKEREEQAVAYSKDVLKVRSVPTIFVDGEKKEIEAYTPEAMIRLLR